MARRHNPTIPELMAQYQETGVMPAEFTTPRGTVVPGSHLPMAGLDMPEGYFGEGVTIEEADDVLVPAPVQTSAPSADAIAHARMTRRRGKVKVPKISNWKRTPKQRGLKQGYQWKPPMAWRPASGMFYIFPAPNKRNQGATRFFYVTDGQQVLSTQHRTKAEATKALKGILSGQEAKLRVNPPNPLNRREAAMLRHDQRAATKSAAAIRARIDKDESYVLEDYNLGFDEGTAAAHQRTIEDFGPPEHPGVGIIERGIGDRPSPERLPRPSRRNPPQVDVLRELGEVRRANPLDDRETRKVMGRRNSSRTLAQRHPSHDVRQFHGGAGYAYNDVVTQFGVPTGPAPTPSSRKGKRGPQRRANVDAHGMPGSLVPAYGRDYKSQKAVKEDWYGGKDFIIADITSRWDGKPMSIRDVPEGWRGHIQIRFDGLRKLWVYTGGPPPKKKAKKKKRENPRRKPLGPGGRELSYAQRRTLRKLYDLAACMERVGLNIGTLSTLGALKRRGLVSEIKKGFKITAKGRKAIGAPAKGKRRRNPPVKTKHKKAVSRVRKNAKPRRPRGQRKRAAQKAARYTFTVGLEKGAKGAKCRISYPTGLFKTQAEALRSIQRELRAKFKQLKKAPVITSCAWKYTDAAKTKGKWHFTAKKR